MRKPKIALVHDDLVQWGGAEKVLAAISDIFPDAPIYTSVYNRENNLIEKYFGTKNIITSFLQKIPSWKSLYKPLMPLYPIAFEMFDFSGFDIVISQTTRFAKSIITKPNTKHICYCHTPPRFLWNFSGDETSFLLKPYFKYLKIYDLVASGRVDFWVAGSINAQERIKKIYNADSVVIYPFVDTDKHIKAYQYDGNYLLVISRLNKYKRIDLAISAAERLKIPIKVVGSGPERIHLERTGGNNTEFFQNVDDEILEQLLLGCKAVIVPGEEDFGLVALEAQSFGKPVIAYGKGGSLETVVDSQTGYIFYEQSIEGVISALDKLYKRGYNQKRCTLQVNKFSKKIFMEKFKNLIFSL